MQAIDVAYSLAFGSLHSFAYNVHGISIVFSEDFSVRGSPPR
jgi:hypothetical protein